MAADAMCDDRNALLRIVHALPADKEEAAMEVVEICRALAPESAKESAVAVEGLLADAARHQWIPARCRQMEPQATARITEAALVVPFGIRRVTGVPQQCFAGGAPLAGEVVLSSPAVLQVKREKERLLRASGGGPPLADTAAGEEVGCL